MKKDIEKIIADKNITNILLIGSKSRDEQNLFLNACDIGLITLTSGMKGLGVPSKAYNIMAVGKPILYIGDKTSEIDRYIMKYNNGWSFDWECKHLLIDFLSKLNVGERQKILNKGYCSIDEIRLQFSKESALKLFNLLN